jgi:hypothetical protein
MKCRSRSVGCVALLSVLALTLIAGCGGTSGPSAAELAAQDKQVEAADHAAAAYARVVAVAQRQRRQRERVRIAVLRARQVRRRREVSGWPVLQSVGLVPANICAPIRGGTLANRRERRLLRRQLLYNLNLRC